MPEACLAPGGTLLMRNVTRRGSSESFGERGRERKEGGRENWLFVLPALGAFLGIVGRPHDRTCTLHTYPRVYCPLLCLRDALAARGRVRVTQHFLRRVSLPRPSSSSIFAAFATVCPRHLPPHRPCLGLYRLPTDHYDAMKGCLEDRGRNRAALSPIPGLRRN